MGPADSRAPHPAGTFRRWWSRRSPLARVGVILLPPVLLCCGLVPALAVVGGQPEDPPAPDGTPVTTATTAPSRTTPPASAAPSPPSKSPPPPSPSTSSASASPSPTPSSPTPTPHPPSAGPRVDQRYPNCAAVVANGLGPYRQGVDPEFEWYRTEDANQDGTVCASAEEQPPAPVNPEPTDSIEPPPDGCHPSYPDTCIPPPPPDLDCGDVPDTDFTVLPPDPHRFDRDQNGIGCES